MADYLAQGNKTVKCSHCGHLCEIPFQTTIHKCQSCNNYIFFTFHGVVIDKNGNYVY